MAMAISVIAVLLPTAAFAQVQGANDTVTVTQNDAGKIDLALRDSALDGWEDRAYALKGWDGAITGLLVLPEGKQPSSDTLASFAQAYGAVKAEMLTAAEAQELFPGQQAILDALGTMLETARSTACSMNPTPSEFTTGTDLTVNVVDVVQGTIRFDVMWTKEDLCG